jgi:hypothetical protein
MDASLSRACNSDKNDGTRRNAFWNAKYTNRFAAFGAHFYSSSRTWPFLQQLSFCDLKLGDPRLSAQGAARCKCSERQASSLTRRVAIECYWECGAGESQLDVLRGSVGLLSQGHRRQCVWRRNGYSGLQLR